MSWSVADVPLYDETTTKIVFLNQLSHILKDTLLLCEILREISNHALVIKQRVSKITHVDPSKEIGIKNNSQELQGPQVTKWPFSFQSIDVLHLVPGHLVRT